MFDMLAELWLQFAAWSRELSGRGAVAGRSEHGLWLYTRAVSLRTLGTRRLGKHARCVAGFASNTKRDVL